MGQSPREADFRVVLHVIHHPLIPAVVQNKTFFAAEVNDDRVVFQCYSLIGARANEDVFIQQGEADIPYSTAIRRKNSRVSSSLALSTMQT